MTLQPPGIRGMSAETRTDRLFDWDRSHTRRDAYRTVDHIAAQYMRGYCDEPALREAQRVCSALGPLGDRR